MKPDLYICHTPYQVLVTLCRAFDSPCPPQLILSTTIPDADSLAARVSATGLVEQVRIFDENACGSSLLTGFWPTLLFQHIRGRRNVEKYYGFCLCGADYANVYIFNDWSVLGRYLQDKNIHYTLCEDAFGCTCCPVHSLVNAQLQLPFLRLRRAVGYGYLYWGGWKGVKAVETECKANANSHYWGKLVERSQRAMFHRLTADRKRVLCNVFLTHPLPEESPEGAVLFLTRDFVCEYLMDADTQARMYKAVVEKYCSGGPLFIKAHPRDATDYAALFPGAVVLDRSMPSEVLNFALPFRFARAVTVESTVLKAFEAADEKVSLTLDEALALARA